MSLDLRIASVTALIAFLVPFPARAQSFLDPGFESTAVTSGGFVKPTSGDWLFGNDAGVVEPFAPNSSTGPLDTWSATFTPMEGQQYASTYAGGDTIRQALTFSSAGTYRVSVYAAAPSGTVTIPTVGTRTLVDGEFTLTLDNLAIGTLHTVPLGSEWALYDGVFTVAAPGIYDLGIRNTKLAPYFVNYDLFDIQSVPEPSSLALLMGASTTLLAGSGIRSIIRKLRGLAGTR